jgi:hypothetical protein
MEQGSYEEETKIMIKGGRGFWKGIWFFKIINLEYNNTFESHDNIIP